MRLFGIVVFMYSVNLLAYPIILKITNKCNNVLHIQSKVDDITIPSGKTLELLVFCAEGWDVRYASGLAGMWDWNFDEPLADHIQGCKGWYRTPDVFYVCTLEFVDHQRGVIAKSYVMKTVEVVGEEQRISTVDARTALSAYYDSMLGIVTEDAKPELRRTLTVKDREPRNAFRGGIQRLVFPANGKPESLIEHSKILAALVVPERDWDRIELGPTPGAPEVPSLGIVAAVAATLWNLLPGK